MEDKKPARKSSSFLVLLLKIAVSVACLWYVSTKIDFGEAFKTIGRANPFLLLAALLAFIVSKWVSAIRLNIYFGNIGFRLPSLQNLRLYWLGMFYNLFLPGSVSGDAYKVILLRKRYDVPYKKTTAAVLLDRFSGLLGLGLILAVYGLLVLKQWWLAAALAAGALLAVAVFYVIIKKFFRDFLASFVSTLALGTAVQACQVVCAYLIMAALGIPAHVTEYIFLFLVSSVVSVLPLTVGGVGIRELVFLEGARYFGLAKEPAVAISLVFYLVTLFTSAWGILYVFRDPLKEKRTQE